VAALVAFIVAEGAAVSTAEALAACMAAVLAASMVAAFMAGSLAAFTLAPLAGSTKAGSADFAVAEFPAAGLARMRGRAPEWMDFGAVRAAAPWYCAAAIGAADRTGAGAADTTAGGRAMTHTFGRTIAYAATTTPTDNGLQYSYYCSNPAGYYPSVTQCSVPRQSVPAG
jgi:hypothetical protein